MPKIHPNQQPIKTHLNYKDTVRLKVKKWKKTHHENTNYMKPGVAILVSDKIGSRPKNVARHKVGHFIMTKVTTQQENIIILSVYADNKKKQKQKLTELERHMQIHNYSW